MRDPHGTLNLDTLTPRPPPPQGPGDRQAPAAVSQSLQRRCTLRLGVSCFGCTHSPPCHLSALHVRLVELIPYDRCSIAPITASRHAHQDSRSLTPQPASSSPRVSTHLGPSVSTHLGSMPILFHSVLDATTLFDRSYFSMQDLRFPSEEHWYRTVACTHDWA